MFRCKWKPPDTPFAHGDDCKLVAMEPDLRPEWSHLGNGYWRRECACSFEAITEPIVDDRLRLDPYDPKTSRHLGQCEYINTADAAVTKVLLKVTDKGDYDWVECGSCGAG